MEKTQPGFFENLEQVLKMGQEDPVIKDLQPHEPDLIKEYDVDYEHHMEDFATESETPSLREEYEITQADYSTYSAEQFQMEGQMATEPMELVHLDEENENKPDYFEIVKNFDARTAVIYSAIINRINY